MLETSLNSLSLILTMFELETKSVWKIFSLWAQFYHWLTLLYANLVFNFYSAFNMVKFTLWLVGDMIPLEGVRFPAWFLWCEEEKRRILEKSSYCFCLPTWGGACGNLGLMKVCHEHLHSTDLMSHHPQEAGCQMAPGFYLLSLMWEMTSGSCGSSWALRKVSSKASYPPKKRQDETNS